MLKPNVTPQHVRNVHARWDRGTGSQGCAQLSCSKRVRHLLVGTWTGCLRGFWLPSPRRWYWRCGSRSWTSLRRYATTPAWTRWSLQGLMKEEGYCSEQDSTSLVAPSGATSTSHSTLTYGHCLPVQTEEWRRTRGGDPRTVHATCVTGGDRKTDHATLLTGGDPKTDHATSMTGGDPKTDHAFLGETGGDPKTDLAIYCAGAFSVDSGSSPREGGGAGIPNCFVCSSEPACSCLVRGP